MKSQPSDPLPNLTDTSTQFSKECVLIEDAIDGLCQYLEKECRVKRGRRRNLFSGYLATRIESLAAERRCDPKIVLMGFVDAAKIEIRRFARLGIKTTDTLYRALIAREMERQDLTSLKVIESSVLNKKRRRDWILTLAPLDAHKELRCLCDWIEAQYAGMAFSLWLADRKTLSSDELEARAHLVINLLHYEPSFSLKEKSKRRRSELDDLGQRFDRDDPDALKPVVEAHLHVAVGKPKRLISQLERQLFLVWPLVQHGGWSMAELCKAVEDSEVRFDEAEMNRLVGRPDTFCGDLGLRRLSQRAGRPVSRRSPPGFNLALFLLRGGLPKYGSNQTRAVR